jgi:hypothetical protein
MERGGLCPLPPTRLCPLSDEAASDPHVYPTVVLPANSARHYELTAGNRTSVRARRRRASAPSVSASPPNDGGVRDEWLTNEHRHVGHRTQTRVRGFRDRASEGSHQTRPQWPTHARPLDDGKRAADTLRMAKARCESDGWRGAIAVVSAAPRHAGSSTVTEACRTKGRRTTERRESSGCVRAREGRAARLVRRRTAPHDADKHTPADRPERRSGDPA